MCHCVRRLKGASSKCTQEDLHVSLCVCPYFWLRTQQGGGAWTPGLTQTCTPHLQFRILIKMKSKWLAPLPLYFSGWIVTSIDSKRPHNSLTVTFRRHFTEIIFILIYRKLSSTLQECHFKVPSIQLHPPPLSLLLLLLSSPLQRMLRDQP